MAISLRVVSSLLAANSAVSSHFRNLPASGRDFRAATICSAAKQAVETEKREPRGLMKPRRVSPEMKAFLGGTSEIKRADVLKEVWAHIKTHNLQDPANKKVIICDAKLKTIFPGKDQIGFLEIARLITPHFL
ncbi:hypothetical protein M569_05012 [Genlisea aurea]|uniref:DM2 domain-containing protein n=1 Tax=Genlisea aurea TaxID=192259 RepID=S8E242_9LAMI|nr:hypothetical protein M569_05012 [Genlisea aurea]